MRRKRKKRAHTSCSSYLLLLRSFKKSLPLNIINTLNHVILLQEIERCEMKSKILIHTNVLFLEIPK